jgi:DNA-binding NarL/FixJ family response regulator
MSHKIIIADNHSVFRAGVARILAVENEFRIVAQCDDPPHLIKAVESSLRATSLFATEIRPDLPILIRKTMESGGHAVAILENNEDPQPYLKQGVNGIIHRDVLNTELLRCLRHVGKGKTYVQCRSNRSSPGLENDLVGTRTRDRLTPKELAIVGLILQGYKNKDIAAELKNSEQVIKNYLRSIFDKTGVSDRLELALFVMHHQILAEAATDAGVRRPVATALLSSSQGTSCSRVQA